MSDQPDQSLSEKALRRRERKAQRAEKQINQLAKTKLTPRNDNQRRLLHAFRRHPVCFAIGPAGVGKTYLAARHALSALMDSSSSIERIVVTRAVASPPRHRLGFLPGNANAKMKPWLIPIFDGFRAETSQANIDKMIQAGQIEIVPFEYMRGRTFDNSIIILDEGQNATLGDLRLLITRTGQDAQLIIAGDPDDSQIDIEDSGLDQTIHIARSYNLNAGIVEFDEDDVVRSETAREWVQAFNSAKACSFCEHREPVRLYS